MKLKYQKNWNLWVELALGCAFVPPFILLTDLLETGQTVHAQS